MEEPLPRWYQKKVTEVLSSLGTSTLGLTTEESEKRQVQYGPNALAESKPDGFLLIFLRQFQSPLIYILLIASAVVFFVGETVDALIILSVLLINAIVGVVQEGKTQNTFLALKRFTRTDSALLRDSTEVIVPDVSLVPGDIILIREGDKIPADARIISVNNLKVDESALTGESKPITKTAQPLSAKEVPTADQKNMIFKATFAVSGSGRAVVTAIGRKTIVGKISEKLGQIDAEIPLKKDIRNLSRLITVVILVLSFLLFFVGLAYGNSVREMFLTSVAIAISVIPEGLPIVISLILATGVYRMAKQNALVKRLQAVEALGQANVLALDKTGTITRNELMVERIYIDGKEYEVGGNGYEGKGTLKFGQETINPLNHPELLLAGKIAAFCANAAVSFLEKEKRWRVAGEPIEAALLVFGEKIGFQKSDLENEEPQIMEILVTSKTKYHVTLHQGVDKRFLTVVGAPETVLPLAKNYYSLGLAKHLSDSERKRFQSVVRSMTGRGLRVVVFAYNDNAPANPSIEKMPALTIGGIFGMSDVIRQGVAESVELARASGVEVIMITGDHRITGEAIAKKAGIYRKGDDVLTGEDFDNLSERELEGRLKNVTLFARVTPEHKLKIIEMYKKKKQVIAMTGDGVNDALSLVAADLGVAMGVVGTEVTKEASDIVLLDDNFRSIISAMEEGRHIFQTIKKVVLYLFSTGLGELGTIVFALFLSFPLPLLPSQIIWLNLVTDSFLVVAMAAEPKEKLEVESSRREHKLIDGLMIGRIFLMGAVMSAGTLFLFAFEYKTDIVKAWTMVLTVLAVFQWLNAWNCRSRDKSVFSENPFSNRFLVGSLAIVITLQLAAVYLPFMQKILRTTALGFSDWLLVVAVSFSVILFEELRKLIYRWSSRKLSIPHHLLPAAVH